jgi:transposase
MIQRNGEVVLHMLANAQQKTIQPILTQTIQLGSLIFTDEYDIYARLEHWGFRHKTVNHSAGEYARDDDGDGFCVQRRDVLGGIIHDYLRAAA